MGPLRPFSYLTARQSPIARQQPRISNLAMSDYWEEVKRGKFLSKNCLRNGVLTIDV